MEQEQIVCPKCHSDQISANQKGFNNKSAALGLLTGSAMQGVAYGMVGSNKVQITCLKCGNVFEPGAGAIKSTDGVTNESSITYQTPDNSKKNTARMIALVLLIVIIIFFLWLVS